MRLAGVTPKNGRRLGSMGFTRSGGLHRHECVGAEVIRDSEVWPNGTLRELEPNPGGSGPTKDPG